MPNNVMPVPATVAVCPHCGGALYLDVDEWDAETGVPTETGTHIYCVNEPDDDATFDIHYQMPYVYWLPLHARVYPWVAQRVRVVERLIGRTFGNTRTETTLEVRDGR